MYHIQDYRKRAIDKIVPYLIEFPDLVSVIEKSADRYQAIEDVLWNIANNFKVADSRGVFLTAHANNEVVNINYTDNADDAFTYANSNNLPSSYDPQYNAYGTGHYYSQSSYISGIRKTLTEDKTIRAVLSQIIQNNTNCTVEDLIEALKLLYNAENVRILESNPLRVNVELIGSNIELSSSGNYENIKKMLPACVYLSNIYVNPLTYDVFKYDTKSAYGISRYPVRVGDTTDIYRYISNAITLNKTDHEYIKRDISIFEPDRNSFDKSKIMEGIYGGDAFVYGNDTIKGGNAKDISNEILFGGTATSIEDIVSNDGILSKGVVQCLLNRNFYYYAGDSWEFSTRLKMKDYLGNSNTSVFSTKFMGSSFIGLYTHPSYTYSYFYARRDNGNLIKDFTADTALYAGKTYNITWGWDKDSKRLYIRRSEDGINYSEESIILNDFSDIEFVFRPSVFIDRDVEWIDLKQTTFSINNVEVYNCNKNKTNYFNTNMFCYVTGSVVSSTNGDVFVSCSDLDTSNGFEFGVNNNKLALTYNNTVYSTDIDVENGKDYSFMIANIDGTLKVWGIQSVRIAGQNLNNDISYINNVIFNKTPLITVNNVETIQSDIYFNCKNTDDGVNNFGDFTYYAIIIGSIDSNEKISACTEYYVTSFGEKHILFNCLNNLDHLEISTDNTRSTNLVTHQSVYNYKYNHSCNRYLYLDGESYITYKILNNNISCNINSFDISFDITHPVSINTGVILSNILGVGSEIGITQDYEFYIKYLYNNNGIISTETVIFDKEDIPIYDVSKYRFNYDGNSITMYKNSDTVQIEKLEQREPVNLASTLYVGSSNSGSNNISCLLRNLNIDIIYNTSNLLSISIPFAETLKDTTKVIEYNNYGARFISVPQLISNKDNTDLYDNTVIRYN